MKAVLARGVVLVALAVACLGFGAIGGTAAYATTTHVFDPQLSLTGSCQESAADPIPDPGCPGGLHPSSPFTSPRDIAVDPWGDMYVVNYGPESAQGTQGTIDIFDATGNFITDIQDSQGPKAAAVDSSGNLYVFETLNTSSVGQIRRFEPSSYSPATGELKYEEPPDLVYEREGDYLASLAVNPENDHLFYHASKSIKEFSSAC